MTEELLKLFQVPEVRRLTNCVCFAMGNPFAFMFRGAYDGDHVNVEIGRAEETDVEKVNDVHVWYGNGHYHFAVEFVKGYVITQHGRGGPIRAYKTDVAMQMGMDYYPKYKRLSGFELAIKSSIPVEDILLLEDACKDPKCHGAIISIFITEAKDYFKGLYGVKDKIYQKYRDWIVSPYCPYGKKYPSIPLGEIYESNISRDNKVAIS
jgi:hypothetical protein